MNTVGAGGGPSMQEAAGGASSAELIPARDRPMVLIVDDDPDVRRLVSLVLHNQYMVLEADNAEAAIRLLDRSTMAGSLGNPIRAVLVDIMMPGIDGLALCRRIKKEFGIPVIMITARASYTDVTTAVQNGADDYLVKPFDHRLLVDRVTKHVSRYAHL